MLLARRLEQDAGSYQGLPATQINPGGFLATRDGTFLYASMAPTADLGCGWEPKEIKLEMARPQRPRAYSLAVR